MRNYDPLTRADFGENELKVEQRLASHSTSRKWLNVCANVDTMTVTFVVVQQGQDEQVFVDFQSALDAYNLI